jgi:hypothetical protein
MYMKHSAIVGRIFFHMSQMALSKQSCLNYTLQKVIKPFYNGIIFLSWQHLHILAVTVTLYTLLDFPIIQTIPNISCPSVQSVKKNILTNALLTLQKNVMFCQCYNIHISR